MPIFRIIPTIGALLAEAAKNLEQISVSARLDAELMLAFVLDKPRSYLFSHADEQPDDDGTGRRAFEGEDISVTFASAAG